MYPYQDFENYQRRRKPRNDPCGRDYICPCGKSYLSYPALFTHIKQKHNGKAPGAIIKPKSQNTGKRGRPKMTIVIQQISENIFNLNDQNIQMVSNRFVEWLNERYKGDIKKYQSIYNQSYIIKRYYQQEHICQFRYNVEEQLYIQPCDYVFLLFLSEMEKKITPQAFDALSLLIAILHRALNQKYKEDFTSKQPAKQIIEIANELSLNIFNTYLSESNKQQFRQDQIIMLVKQFFNWLFAKKFTHHKLKTPEDQ